MADSLPIVIKLDDREFRFGLIPPPSSRVGNGFNVPYEMEVYDAMARFVQPGDFVVDGGASIGMCTFLLSQLVGDGGFVLAIEPDPVNGLQLHKNIELNNSRNVICLHNALWRTDCFKEFRPMKLHTASSGFFLDASFSDADGVSGPPINVFSRSLDTLLASNPALSHPRLIKLDCEGAEAQILLGAEKILMGGIDCLIVEFHFPIMALIGSSESDIRSYMRSLDYDCFVLQAGYQPTLISSEMQLGVSGGDGHVNLMFARMEQVNQLWSPAREIAHG